MDQHKLNDTENLERIQRENTYIKILFFSSHFAVNE